MNMWRWVEQGEVCKSSRHEDGATGEISINYTLKWPLIINDIPVRPAISFEMKSSVHSVPPRALLGWLARVCGSKALAGAIGF